MLTEIIKVLFWLAVGVILYVYFGYPFFVILFSRFSSKQNAKKKEVTLPISVIIAAYNEEKMIDDKIKNTLSLDYPRDKIEIIIGSDGSTDRTNEIVKEYVNNSSNSTPPIKLVANKVNRGKSSIQNQAAKEAKGQIIVFTDANVMLRKESLSELIRHFADKRIGCVIGKVTYLNREETSVSEHEGFYWRYELFLRKKESEVGNLAMGSGPIMAIRRELFEPLDPRVGEDFVLPMKTVMKGYRVIYEPGAVSEETLFQNTPASMLKSKVRVISKDLRGLFLCRTILNPFRYPLYAWALISHKLLRWLVSYSVIALFILNLLLLGYPFYNLTLAVQIAFYTMALIGYILQGGGRFPRALEIPFFFCLVNLAALVGVARFVMGRTSGRWVPARF